MNMSTAPARSVAALVGCALACAGVPCAGQRLLIASDDWCPFVCASARQIHGGYLVEATAAALAQSGIDVTAVLMPLNRAILETEHDRLAGVYAPPGDARLRQSGPLGVSRACFYTRSDDHWHYGGIATLDAVSLGVIADYGYDNGPMDGFLATLPHRTARVAFNKGDTAGATNFRKLLSGRYRVALEHEAVAQRLIAAGGWHDQLRQAGCLEHGLPLTVGFSRDNPAAEHWVRALNEGLARMAQSGALSALQRRYGVGAAEHQP